MFPMRCKGDADEVRPSKKARREASLANKTPKTQGERSGTQHYAAPGILPLPAEAFCCGKPDPAEAARSESGSAPWNGRPQIGPAAVGKKARRSPSQWSHSSFIHGRLVQSVCRWKA